MPGTMIEFKANGRTAQGYLARPTSPRGHGLLVIQEYWGLVDHIKDVADRFAAEGFFALAPDLYHGEKAKSPDEAGKLMMALNIAETAKDLRGAADALITNENVSPKKIGIVGFCMGGQLALYAACEYPERIGAAVDFYGIHPKVALNLARLDAPVLAHFALKDSGTPEDKARDLVRRMEQAGKHVEAYFYNAAHAFFNDTRPQVYSRADAHDAWKRTIDFLNRSLGFDKERPGGKKFA
ncbi:MAG: carboxymethylenebutenolidase [Gemmatimonadetes bacterium]|nr:MAG: carboxymethylenebutenolidase [Gemmatimonadota bacterium]